MKEITPETIQPAVLLTNIIFGRLSEDQAKLLNINYKVHTKLLAHLEQPLTTEELLTDPPRAQILRETVERLLGELSSREARTLRLRFGFDTGSVMTLTQVGWQLNPERGLSREQVRNIHNRGVRRLRNHSTSRFLQAFYEGIPTERLTDQLRVLQSLK